PGYSGYDGFSWAYNTVSRTYMFVFHDVDSADNLVQELALDGRLSPIVAAITFPGNGNFEPSITACGDRREWLILTANNFASVIGARVRSYFAP
ncbi:MAG TPA: hypothetical protein VFV50_12330, partial [Bdellovibrionales bacterium]|nr:hypothetical protein [Bdellovibrionales bacterium]